MHTSTHVTQTNVQACDIYAAWRARESCDSAIPENLTRAQLHCDKENTPEIASARGPPIAIKSTVQRRFQVSFFSLTRFFAVLLDRLTLSLQGVYYQILDL
jgi:hypothetical protein